MPQSPDGLTEAETTCLLLTAKGRSTDEIAELFGGCEGRVTAHLASAREKLVARSTMEAVARALRLGLID